MVACSTSRSSVHAASSSIGSATPAQAAVRRERSSHGELRPLRVTATTTKDRSLSPKDAVSTACGRFVQTDEKMLVALRRPLIPYLKVETRVRTPLGLRVDAQVRRHVRIDRRVKGAVRRAFVPRSTLTRNVRPRLASAPALDVPRRSGVSGARRTRSPQGGGRAAGSTGSCDRGSREDPMLGRPWPRRSRSGRPS
jgi:hypothetical protein